LCGTTFIQRSNRQKACLQCRAATDGHRPIGHKRAPDPVCVDCGQAYPRRGGPTVTRCEACQTKRIDPEHEDRLRRIEASTPPAHTIEGQLQRRVRDRDREDADLETVWSGGEGPTSY
jgi:hypothetical protein